ncbi:MAG: M23 family metallopeptidase [Rhizobiales bacterium]|nr:M23 family metallopeptidase [Hyphomicrobiales bacterium]
MKKKPGQLVMQGSRLGFAGRPMPSGIVALMVTSLLLAACTTYRPLDRGATVPWAKALAAAQGGPIDGNRYRVERGDALSAIAARYDIRLSTLAAVNNIEAPYILYPGEVLRIPDDAPLPARRPEIIQTAIPPAEPAAPSPPSAWKRQTEPAPLVSGQPHLVAEGESLALIAVRYKLTLGELVAANHIDSPYRIAPGQTLIIPIRESQDPGPETTEPGGSSTAPAPPLSAEGFMWPVYGKLIGTFEQRGVIGRSGGVNIAANKGTPVRASENGVVAYAGEALSGYGRLVMLRHADGYVTLYAHSETILVQEGDVVQRGQTIAEVGDSGDVSESQLHFEVRKGKAPIDPTKFLAGLPGRQVGAL